MIKKKDTDWGFFPLLFMTSLLICGWLSYVTYYINHWPTDSYTPYIPTAAKLSSQPFLSQMHTIPQQPSLQLTMRGKEALIVGIAFFQDILRDTSSLYPNVLLLIIATFISSLCLYQLGRRLFSPLIGVLGYSLFIFSFWSYIYILQGAHQPLVLMNFLLSCCVLLIPSPHPAKYLGSGFFLGLMMFSSPTATLYLFYFIPLCVYHELKLSPALPAKIWQHALWLSAGGLAVFLLFTLPDPLYNLKEFIRYLKFSQSGNNFIIYQQYLSADSALPPTPRGAGVRWIFHYFFLIMPVLFNAYLVGLVYLLRQSLRNPQLLFVAGISLGSPVLIELSGVAQFGRNYHAWFVGIIFLVCFSLHHYWQSRQSTWNRTQKKRFILLVLAVAAGHGAHNAFVFFNDVLPSPLATTRIYQWLKRHGENEVYVYARHPRNLNFVQFLNNPQYQQKLQPLPLRTIREATRGYILIPPITGRSIFQECRLPDFMDDFYLTELYYSPEFKNYVAASFKTLASSKTWVQEEEICTYMDLMLNRVTAEDRQKGQAFLLDAAKLQREWFSRYPQPLKIF